jgi:hypothetical protein
LLPDGVVFKEVIIGAAAESAQTIVKCSGLSAGKTSKWFRISVRARSAVKERFRMAGWLSSGCQLRPGLREAMIEVKQAMGMSNDLEQIGIEDARVTITVQ